jgi:hypothetical protein
MPRDVKLLNLVPNKQIYDNIAGGTPVFLSGGLRIVFKYRLFVLSLPRLF